jgi:fermentation-respiration switch protein FrsA (DUF1100 family)
MEEDVTFDSDGIQLAATFYKSDTAKGRLPGIVLGHGFAGARYPKMARRLADLGYAVLSIDFRGYGQSGGERGRVMAREQVSDFKNSVTYLSNRPDIDADRIGIIGSSLGGSIAIMATPEDPRIKFCVAGCPIAKGDTTFRLQYDTEAKFKTFLERVAQARAKGEKLARFEIVFIPENLRSNLPKGTPMEFSPDTVDGFLSLNPLDTVSKIAPRPLFIIHAEDDHVVPFEDAQELARRAGPNCKLEIIAKGDHFIFGMDSVIDSIANWLLQHQPPGKAA